jgi:hypothetical protein
MENDMLMPDELRAAIEAASVLASSTNQNSMNNDDEQNVFNVGPTGDDHNNYQTLSAHVELESDAHHQHHSFNSDFKREDKQAAGSNEPFTYEDRKDGPAPVSLNEMDVLLGQESRDRYATYYDPVTYLTTETVPATDYQWIPLQVSSSPSRDVLSQAVVSLLPIAPPGLPTYEVKDSGQDNSVRTHSNGKDDKESRQNVKEAQFTPDTFFQSYKAVGANHQQGAWGVRPKGHLLSSGEDQEGTRMSKQAWGYNQKKNSHVLVNQQRFKENQRPRRPQHQAQQTIDYSVPVVTSGGQDGVSETSGGGTQGQVFEVPAGPYFGQGHGQRFGPFQENNKGQRGVRGPRKGPKQFNQQQQQQHSRKPASRPNGAPAPVPSKQNGRPNRQKLHNNQQEEALDDSSSSGPEAEPSKNANFKDSQEDLSVNHQEASPGVSPAAGVYAVTVPAAAPGEYSVFPIETIDGAHDAGSAGDTGTGPANDGTRPCDYHRGNGHHGAQFFVASSPAFQAL